MLNQIVLVGRLVENIKVQGENDRKYAVIKLAVPRSFKNAEGEYETDFIDCITFEGVAENTANYCKKGDIIGVKGRIQSRVCEKYHTKQNIIEIIAEKITFLSSKKEND